MEWEKKAFWWAFLFFSIPTDSQHKSRVMFVSSWGLSVLVVIRFFLTLRVVV